MAGNTDMEVISNSCNVNHHPSFDTILSRSPQHHATSDDEETFIEDECSVEKENVDHAYLRGSPCYEALASPSYYYESGDAADDTEGGSREGNACCFSNYLSPISSPYFSLSQDFSEDFAVDYENKASRNEDDECEYGSMVPFLSEHRDLYQELVDSMQ